MNINIGALALWPILHFLVISSSVSAHEEDDHLLCRKCGIELTENSKENYVNVTSPLSEASHLLSALGHSNLLVQKLRNPSDVAFDLVVVKKAGCIGIDKWYSEHTWFPGYSWKVCVCPRCKVHLGWIFELTKTTRDNQIKASSEGFYGLILEKLITEDFSDSLLIGIPKLAKY